MAPDNISGNTPDFDDKTPWLDRPGGILLVHALRMTLIGFVAGPIAVAFALVLGEAFLVLPVSLLLGLVCGALSFYGRRMPPRASARYGIALFLSVAMIPAFFPAIFLLAFDGALSALRFAPAVYVIGLLLGFVLAEQRRADRVPFLRIGWIILGLCLVVPVFYIASGVYGDMTYADKRGHGFERVGGFSSTNLKPYDPRVPGAITPRLAEASSFAIRGAEGLPVLDGAEAAFPVYAAFAAACYPDMPPLSDDEVRGYDYRGLRSGPLRFTNTIRAFERLVTGEVDIFFGAHPSEAQMRMAAEKGKELVLTPIGKEAFVFFVNEANPVGGLRSAQLRDVYSGKVRNWRELGGADVEIIAFQRPENSGSQTIMHRFMGDVRMELPLRDRYVGGMGGVVERVSEYRNAPSALGYSFRFFLTGLGMQPKIKMLAVDGVAPTAESIVKGEYPYVVNLFAVTVKGNANAHVGGFLDWMVGVQGQELVERVGYLGVK